jgi:hypothetical protein
MLCHRPRARRCDARRNACDVKQWYFFLVSVTPVTDIAALRRYTRSIMIRRAIAAGNQVDGYQERAALSYDQLRTGLTALALLEVCCQDALLVMEELIMLAGRDGSLSGDQLRYLGERTLAIRRGNLCRCERASGAGCELPYFPVPAGTTLPMQ